MKEVTQTRLHKPPESYGNCFPACIASILEMEIRDIPKFEIMPGDLWWSEFTSWAKWKGYEIDYYAWGTNEKPERAIFANLEKMSGKPAGYSILCGKSPRGDWDHCVVALDGMPVWDPSPLRSPFGIKLEDVRDYIVMRPIQ